MAQPQKHSDQLDGRYQMDNLTEITIRPLD